MAGGTEAREGTIELRDGRRLRYRDAGDPADPPVVSHHGTPGSRIPVNPDPGVGEGIRVVTYDRPGYGGSDPRPERRVADVAEDVASLADALGLERFAVIGGSGGGPHALATAALLPERVTRVAVLVGVGPADADDLDFAAGMAEVNTREIALARGPIEPHRAFLRPDVESIKADPEAFLDHILTQMPDADRIAMDTPGARESLRRHWLEAVAQDEEGLLEDGRALLRPWGFALEDVRCEARFWQGELDTLVPRAHGEYMASRIPNARFELIPAEGHLIFGHQRTAYAWVAGLTG